MRYQYKREPLTQEEANHLAQACKTYKEKLVIWTLLDTGLRVSEFATLTQEHIDWQTHRLIIHGRGGPYVKQSKRRVIPLSPRVRQILEGHLAFHYKTQLTVRTIQRLVERVANRAHIQKPVSPHVLRHTFSVIYIQKGISTKALQELLGQDRLATLKFISTYHQKKLMQTNSLLIDTRLQTPKKRLMKH